MFLPNAPKFRALALSAALLAGLNLPGFAGEPGQSKSDMASQQQEYNQDPSHKDCAKKDQCEQRQSNGGQDASSSYYSKPSADRTMRNFYYFNIPGQDQDKQDCSGGECPTKGDQGVYDQQKPLATPNKLLNANMASLVQGATQFAAQVSTSPQAAAGPAKAGMQSQAEGAAEAGAAASMEGLEQALAILVSPLSTANVANEATGTPGSTLIPFRPISQAFWMVQRMFHSVYIPMALLLLLPGALLIQVKVAIKATTNTGIDEDTQSPFSGIQRAIIGIFLIPCTQLIVSYSIDVGNSLTHEVSKGIKAAALLMWAKQTFGDNMTPRNGAQTCSTTSPGNIALKAVWNQVNMTLSYGLLILNAFQIALMCYLLCMGPIAAAFYVWPTGVGRLFRPVFANWVDAVMNLALWKFWWCIIVLCMITRINVLTAVEGFMPDSEWEALMFTCFLVMMSYVPFMPFELKPGEMVDKLLQKAQELKKAGGGQAGG